MTLQQSAEKSVLGATELDGRSLKKIGPFAMGLILMAGSAADNYWRTERVGIVSGGDLIALQHMQATSHDLRALYLAVRPLIAKHRRAIDKLAKALTHSRTLNAAEIRKILRK